MGEQWWLRENSRHLSIFSRRMHKSCYAQLSRPRIRQATSCSPLRAALQVQPVWLSPLQCRNLETITVFSGVVGIKDLFGCFRELNAPRSTPTGAASSGQKNWLWSVLIKNPHSACWRLWR
jgi:hypothetical protein